MPPTIEQPIHFFRQQFHLENHYKVLPSLEDMHITLLYIGTLQEGVIDALKPKLTTAGSSTMTFSVRMNHLAYFGNETGPRVVYLGFEHCDALQQLQLKISKLCMSLFPINQRSVFIPHCTIAKKRVTSESLQLSKQFFEPIEIPIKSFSLFAIHPERQPKYEAIHTFHLYE